MSYRDDLAAAQARADAAMRSLAVEREAREDDAEHVARLERTLAKSLHELAELREQSAPTASHEGPHKATIPAAKSASKTNSKGVGLVVLLTIVGLCVAALPFYLMTSSDNTAYETSSNIEYGIEPEVSVRPVPPKPPPMEFDVMAGLPAAARMADTYFGDGFLGAPFLVRIHATAVDDQGKSHLQYGEVNYRYVIKRPPIPANAVPESTAPLGARPPPKTVGLDMRPCYVDVIVTQDGMALSDLASVPGIPEIPGMGMPGMEMFHQRNVGPALLLGILEGYCERPRLEYQCDFVKIRKTAIELGAPHDALATVSIGDEPVQECDDGHQCDQNSEADCCKERRKSWQVRIVDQGETLFDQRIADNCQTEDDEK